MAGPRPEQLGERLSGVEATLAAFERYERDRWHKLADDMQPLVNLPAQLARDIGRIQGTFDGRIASITKEIERSITAAVERAIEPVNADVAMLKSKVEVLESAHFHEAGAKNLASKFLQSPIVGGFIGALLAAMAFVGALLSGRLP